MGARHLNLARAPFLNDRAVIRVAVLLTALSLAAAVYGGRLFWDYYSGASDETRGQLSAVDKAIRETRQTLADADAELARLDLAAHNQQVAFLNHRIAERTFSWSRLFDDLTDVLPNDVKIDRLSPRVMGVGLDGGENEAVGARERVYLDLTGAATDDEGVLEFVDELFRHPRFREPNLQREGRRERMVQFQLNVIYLPMRSSESTGSAEPEPAAATRPAETAVADGGADSETSAPPPGLADDPFAESEDENEGNDSELSADDFFTDGEGP